MLSLLDGFVQSRAEIGLSTATYLRKTLDRGDERRFQRLHRGPRSLEQGASYSFLLAHKRKQEMLRFHGLLATLARQLRSPLKSLLGLLGELVQFHN